MFLFILESIGTSELILIGIVALIFLGPRKLPQIARTIGKTMADFRNTTNEFKATWQREVDFEEELNTLKTFDAEDAVPTVPRIASSERADDEQQTIAPPTVKAVQTDLFDELKAKTEAEPPAESRPEDEETSDEDLSDKRSWL